MKKRRILSMPLLCPINGALAAEHGGYCVEEKCAWWVTGKERIDTVYEHQDDCFCGRACHDNDTSHDCCKDHCQNKTVEGPGIKGGSCALKALAVETHDLNIELIKTRHEFACLFHGMIHGYGRAKVVSKEKAGG